MEKLRKLCKTQRWIDGITFFIALLTIVTGGVALISIMTKNNPILPFSFWWSLIVFGIFIVTFVCLLCLYDKVTNGVTNHIKGIIINDVCDVLETNKLSCTVDVSGIVGGGKQIYALQISCLERDKSEIFKELDKRLPNIEKRLNEVLSTTLKEKAKIRYIRNV